MEMQLTLFEECQLDGDSSKCKDLSDAIEELTAAVAERNPNHNPNPNPNPNPNLTLTPTPTLCVASFGLRC